MINILSDDLIKKIAAGEVVERPSSVIKELIENSLDAKATNIIVHIKNGGLDLIRIEDDGIGIESQDMEKLFHKHSTSKLKITSDLESILTFGFRGEALASISSVSDVTLVTRSASNSEGSIVKPRNGKLSINRVASNVGTSVTIENLFENIPARRKFMKSEKTENSHIVKIFQEIAIVNPLVKFNLFINDKLLLSYDIEEINSRINKIVKSKLSNMSLLFDSSDLKIQGSLLLPGSLQSKGEQYIYINSRIIDSPLITKAIKESYKSFLRVDIKPSFVIFLNINPNLVDVNVHPRKTEIRFLDQQSIYKHVYRGCLTFFENMNKDLLDTFNDLKSYDNEFFSSKDDDKRLLMDSEIRNKVSDTSLKKDSFSSYKNRSVFEGIEFTKNLYKDSIEERPFYDCLQIDNKFIIFFKDNEINIIDQHAASERVNYEKISDEFKSKSFDYITLLFPENIELSNEDYFILLDNLATFDLYGIHIEDMGNSIVSVDKFNSNMSISQVSKIIEDIIDSIKKGIDPKNINDKVVASIACRSAIMFGQKLSTSEINKLIEDLYKCRTSLTCAHGRPVFYKISMNELMKKFGRC